MKDPFIVGQKVYLRPLEVDDAENFVTWLNDKEVNKYLIRTIPINKSREREFLEGLYKDNREVILGISLKANDELIGVIGLHKISLPFHNAEMGIFIGDKSRWSKGYGTEAVRLILKYGFDQLNLHRIYLTVLNFNLRAIHVYEKSGFKLEGTFREHVYRHGKYCDVLLMGILRNEWKNLPNSDCD